LGVFFRNPGPQHFFIRNEVPLVFNAAQAKAPIKEALEEFRAMRMVPFDVPGHKRGRGNKELIDFFGKACMEIDVNSMKQLDNLGHPVSVIQEAELLAAQAFGAHYAFFIVNGTTAAVQAMILSVCRRGETLIVPRNVHKSVINAMILSGAVPAYVDPPVNPRLGIPLSFTAESLREAIAAHPEAKAVVVNNPTYYGICSPIAELVQIAHEHGMLLLADEAHAAHFYFGENLPLSAMAAGADMASVSMHKSGGSLTQSSFLLCGKGVDPEGVRRVINITQTTSASYLLLSSLDISRRNLALHGKSIFTKVTSLAAYARDEVNRVGGFYAYGPELVDGTTVADFDATKLSIHTPDTGLSGIEVYDLLRDEYDIQIEFGDATNVLAYISVGDRQRDLERLVGALSEVYRRFRRPPGTMEHIALPPPVVRLTPSEAFYADLCSLPIAQSVGKVCGEIVMCYPPGIPILAPGEEVTREAAGYILCAKKRGCFVSGTKDPTVQNLLVVK
jgi:Arginine/lysine/ornithine decarboxylases